MTTVGNSCDFSGTPLVGAAALSVTFTDQSAPSPLNPGATHTNAWTFGDGGTSTAANPVHVYAAAGVYDVSLTVAYSIGSNPGTNTKIGYVTVTAAAPPPPPPPPPPAPSQGSAMTLPVLPISRLINVAVNLSPKAAAAQALNTMLVLGSSPIIDSGERYRVYASLDAVAADFGTALPEYLAALLWFQQVPQPSSLIIGRWVRSASQAVLRGGTLSAAQQLLSVFTAIAAGEFTYSKDGSAPVTTPAINLSAAANLSAVAALVTAQTPGVTFTWNAYYQRFEATSATAGATSGISLLSAPGSGTDLSVPLGMAASSGGAYAVPGAAPEAAIDACALFELNYGMIYYGVTVLGSSNSDHLAIAPFYNGTTNKHVYFVTTQDAGVLVAATTTDIAYQLKQLGYLRTYVQYSSSNPYAVVSAAARILTTDYTGNTTVITLMYKQEPGIVAESVNTQQADALEAKNCNIFVNYNNQTAIIEMAVTSNGTFLDVVCGTDWLSLAIQNSLYNLLYLTPTKIPQTDAGSQLMVNAIEAVCDQGVRNGLLAPGIWTTTGFGVLALGDFLQKGYYVYAPRVALQNVSDRARRKAVPMQVAAKLAGAVHTIAMSINVNQ